MHGARILIIEDDLRTASALQRLLRAAQHTTVAVNTIAAALSLIDSQPFDLLITDLHLRDGDLLPSIPELRRRQPRIIAVSGSTLLGPDDCDEFGFAAFLRKPIHFEDLQSAISAALHDSRDGTQSAFKG